MARLPRTETLPISVAANVRGLAARDDGIGDGVIPTPSRHG